MRFRPRLHDLYIGKAVLGSVLMAWLVLLGLDLVLSLSGEFKHIGTGSYTFGHALAWAAFTAPRRAYTLFPMAAVIGSLMGLGQLAATSELTALRALGLSRRRLGDLGQAAVAVEPVQGHVVEQQLQPPPRIQVLLAGLGIEEGVALARPQPGIAGHGHVGVPAGAVAQVVRARLPPGPQGLAAGGAGRVRLAVPAQGRLRLSGAPGGCR